MGLSAWGHAWQGEGMCGGGTCMAGGMCGLEEHARRMQAGGTHPSYWNAFSLLLFTYMPQKFKKRYFER